MQAHRTSSDRWFVFLCVLLGAALRLDFLVASNFVIDSDEAIVGLMAKHIFEGAAIPTFYYGQHYMGSFEPLMVSWLMGFVGVNVYALKLVPLLWSLALIVLVYLLGRSIAGSYTGRVAALLCAIAPSTLVVWSAKARGGFIELACIGALAFLVTLSWLKQPRIFLTVIIGALLGFGWWVNNQIIYFMLPIGFLMLGRVAREGVRPTFLHGLSGFVSFLVGGFPFWFYNIQNDFVSFNMFGSSSGSDVLSHLSGAFSLALPIIFGAIRFWQTQDVFPGSTFLVFSLVAILLSVILWARRAQLIKVSSFRASDDSGVELLLYFVVAVVGVFCLSSFGYLVKAPRYMLPLYVAYFPLLAYAIFLIRKSVSLFTANLVIFLFLFVHVASCYFHGRAIPGQPFIHMGERVAKDHVELINWLEQNKVSHVHTNYWIGYRLAFETQEKVKFVMIHEPFQVRIDEYQQVAENPELSKVVYVLVPSEAKLYRKALRLKGILYDEKRLSGYVVIWNLRSRFPGRELSLVQAVRALTSHNQQSADLAIDDKLDTRWASASPQVSGMEYVLELNPAQEIGAIYYSTGRWWHDYPRSLEIVLIGEDGTEQTVLNPAQYKALQYFTDHDTDWTLKFPMMRARGVRLRQLGSHPVFDWTIAELQLYR